MEQAVTDGLVVLIRVSNFLIEHLESLLVVYLIPPSLNQLEIHPIFQQSDLTSFCLKHDIAVEAYSPLRQDDGGGKLCCLSVDLSDLEGARIAAHPDPCLEGIDLFDIALIEMNRDQDKVLSHSLSADDLWSNNPVVREVPGQNHLNQCCVDMLGDLGNDGGPEVGTNA